MAAIIGIVASPFTGLAGACVAATSTPDMIPLRAPFVQPTLPTFGDDGSIAIVNTVLAPKSPYPSTSIEWVGPQRAATVWRVPQLRGSVAGAYLARGTLWLLVDTRPEDGRGTRPTALRFRVARMSESGLVEPVALSGKAPWPSQRLTSGVSNEVWTAGGVFWAHGPFDYSGVEPPGLAWVDNLGRYHPNIRYAGDDAVSSVLDLRGDPEPDIAVGAHDDLWLTVSGRTMTMRDMKIARDSVDRIDTLRSRTLRATAFPLKSGHGEPGGPVAARDGAMWCFRADGALGRLAPANGVFRFFGPGHEQAWERLFPAPDHGVWTIDETRRIARHYDSSMTRVLELSRIPWSGTLGTLVQMSPCGVLWVHVGANNWFAAHAHSTLSSWTIPKIAQPGCLDAARVKPPVTRTATVRGF